MKLLLILLISLSLSACSSMKQQANLLTDNPEGTNYTIFFSGGLLSASDRNDLPVKERHELFEKILNDFLHKDPNTEQCNVLAGTVSTSPLGPGGSAIVRCLESVPVQVDSTSFTLKGKPFYRYWVNGRDGI